MGAWWKMSKHLKVDKEEEIVRSKNEKGEKKIVLFQLPILQSWEIKTEIFERDG